MSAYIKCLFCAKLRGILCVFLVFCVLSVNVSAMGLSAQSAILIDADSGEALYSQNSTQQMPMASTTKIMTAVVAIESIPLDTKIKIPEAAVGIEGSSVYLCAGEILTLEELLYALLLSSANDAATAIAITVGGSVDGFADMMNKTADKIGLKNSHFTNPHGLDDKDHYTTASDLAKLTSYALSLPIFKQIVSTYKYSISFDNKPDGRLLVNHNKLLKSYDGAIGVKTGFTKKSGRCLVSAAEKNGVTLVAVTLNAPNDWQDHTAMLNYGFENYSSVTLGNFSTSVPLISGTKASVNCGTVDEISKTLIRSHGNIKARVELYPFAYAPVVRGEKLGEIVYLCDGKEIGRIDIVSFETVSLQKQKYTIWDKIKDKIKK